jgi:hypothetical protein
MAGQTYGNFVTQQALARQRREREVWEEQQREEQEEAVRENAATRERYLAGLAAQKAEAVRRQEAETDHELGPAKERAQRDYLLAHPGKDAAAFEKLAWPLIRENLIADQRAAAVEATKAKLRSSGLYDF